MLANGFCSIILLASGIDITNADLQDKELNITLVYLYYVRETAKCVADYS